MQLRLSGLPPSIVSMDDTSVRAPPLLAPILHRMLCPHHARLFHTRRFVIDIDRYDQVDRITQSNKGLSALCLLVNFGLRIITRAWMLAIEQGCVGVGCGSRVAIQGAGRVGTGR